MALAASGNPQGSFHKTMPFTTADNGIELLRDVNNGIAEIHDRITARAFMAVHKPDHGPEVRSVLEELLAVLDRTSPDGVI